MPTPKEILAEVKALDKATQGAHGRLKKQIVKLFADVTARLEAFLRNPKALSPRDTYDLAAASKIVTQLDKILREAGLEDFVAAYRDEFPRAAKSALSYFGTMDASLDLVGVDDTTLNAYIRYSELNLRRVVDSKLTAPLQEAVFQGAFGSLRVGQAVEQIIERGTYLTTGQVEVEVFDKLQQFQRAVTVEKAESLGVEIYQYLGPDDSITSPQCEFLLHIDRHGVEGMLYKD